MQTCPSAALHPAATRRRKLSPAFNAIPVTRSANKLSTPTQPKQKQQYFKKVTDRKARWGSQKKMNLKITPTMPPSVKKRTAKTTVVQEHVRGLPGQAEGGKAKLAAETQWSKSKGKKSAAPPLMSIPSV